MLAVSACCSRKTTMSLLPAAKDGPMPILTSTGQPLSAPPLKPAATAVNVSSMALASHAAELRGRKRPSAEHQEGPPTSRLRRGISQEQTPQRSVMPGNGPHEQIAGQLNTTRTLAADLAERRMAPQVVEIPGITTMMSHVSLL